MQIVKNINSVVRLLTTVVFSVVLLACQTAPPNFDLDGDSILNAHDKCPNTRPGVVVDLDGC